MAQQHNKVLWPISNSQSWCSCLPRRNTTLGQATYRNLSRSLPQPLFLFKERHWFAVPSPRWRCCHSKSMPGSGLSSAGRWTFCGLRRWFMSVICTCALWPWCCLLTQPWWERGASPMMGVAALSPNEIGEVLVAVQAQLGSSLPHLVSYQ